MIPFLLYIAAHKIFTDKELLLKDHEVIVDSQYVSPELQMTHSHFKLSPEILKHVDSIVEVPEDIEETIEHIQTIGDELRNGRDTFLLFFTDKLETHSELRYFVSSDKEKAIRVCGYFPGLYAYNALDRVEYKLPLTDNAVEIATSPLFEELTNEIIAKFEGTNLPKFYLFYDDFESIKGFKEIAKKYRNDVNIGHLLFKKEGSLKHVGIGDKNMPAIVTIIEGVKYSEKDLDTQKLDTFLFKFINNQIEPFEMSEEEIEETDELFKRHRITREMYKSGDYNQSLIFFVSKNCGFCTQIKPIIKELIEKNKSKVQICIVDGTKNDFSEFKIKGYPTIAYAEDGDIKYFEGERRFERFVEFVKKSSKEEVDLLNERKEKEDL